MLVKIRVNATGHGLGFNRYPVCFEFLMNMEQNPAERDDDYVLDRVRSEARKKTACRHVTIEKYEILIETVKNRF